MPKERRLTAFASAQPSRVRPIRVALAFAIAAALLPLSASATTTLTVDLASTIRPVSHAASGSLYGVTEKLPADVNALIAPLRPNMFTNPAANVQQPQGDAIAVAGRLAPLGAKVTIRLADWFPGWPYGFTNLNDWLDKVGQTVKRKKDSGLTNYYGYEIWNEPNGTWKSSSLSFNDLWKQTYAKLRELDPEAKIIGPASAGYDRNFINGFLSFAKSNNCLPDIVCWHELSGQDLAANFQNYRSMEQQLGIAPLPISINEYSGKEWLDVEGQPGASAPIIAKFERFKIDSACISYWDVAHAGRLGSLLATDTAKNGGWWFYKWYGDMSGNMVSTTPPSPNNPTALDGFAHLDAATETASALFGGINDGTVQVIVKGFKAAPFFGSQVHALVEHTPWGSRSTVVNATDTVSTADVAVTNDQIAITVSKTNNTDGYRLMLTPVGGPSGAGGTSGSGGRSGADASVDAADASGLGGRSGSGGSGGSTSISSNGGAGGRAGSNGGATSASGGIGATGGAGTTGASGGSAGTSSTDRARGGGGGAGGNPSGTTSSAAGGSSRTGGGESGGCTCAVGRVSPGPGAAALIGLFLVAVYCIRRRQWTPSIVSADDVQRKRSSRRARSQ